MNYSRGKIYRIVCNTTGLTYYGSTIQLFLSQRLRGHIESYHRHLKGHNDRKLTSFKILENNNYEIILVEAFPCNTKDELHSRERFYIENNECVNKNIPTRTKEEYRADNFERLKEKQKITDKAYKEKNRDKILEEKKKYYEKNKEKIQQAKKEYREKNKDKIKERERERYKRKKINTTIVEEPIQNSEPKTIEPIDKYKSQKEYQQKNKEKIYEQRRKKKEEIKALLMSIGYYDKKKKDV